MDAFRSLTHPAIECAAIETLERGQPLSVGPTGSTPGARTLVDVLQVYPEKTEWKNGIDASALPDLFSVDESEEHKVDVKTPKLRVFFLADANFLLVESPGDTCRFAHGNPTVQWMRERFGVSPMFFRAVAFPNNTLHQERMYFLRRDRFGKATRLEGYYEVVECYENRKHAVWFSHTLGEDRSSTYITYNFPDTAREAIATCSQKCEATVLLRPLSIDLFWSQGVFKRLYDILADNAKTFVLTVEANDRLESSLTPETAAAASWVSHTTSRRLHLLHGSCGDLQEITQFLSTMVQKMSQPTSPRIVEDLRTKSETNSTIESLDYQMSQIEHLLRQEAVYHGRISTQIARIFNLSNQLDSRTNLDIARLTSKISVSTQRDSSSMITIAILTMFFLPGTFISAFFSMAFVNSNSDERGRPVVVVGPQIWIYAVVTIILTVLVFCIWGLWHNRRIGQQAKELDIENRAAGVQEPSISNVVAERPREVARKLWDWSRNLAGRVQVRFHNRQRAPNTDAGAGDHGTQSSLSS